MNSKIEVDDFLSILFWSFFGDVLPHSARGGLVRDRDGVQGAFHRQSRPQPCCKTP